MNEREPAYDGSGSRLTRRQRIQIAILAPLGYALCRLIAWTCRIRRVDGAEHLDVLLHDGRTFIPCCWHQRLFFCVYYLVRRKRDGLQPGFIISPSRDGEYSSYIASRLGLRVIRGSAHRTGARALRDLYQIMQNGVSPISHPDGPLGPPHQAKSGSPLLAQISGAPILPMAFSADRYWQLGSWDRLIIPKPFAAITITIGTPVEVSRQDKVGDATERLQTALDETTSAADSVAGVQPAVRQH